MKNSSGKTVRLLVQLKMEKRSKKYEIEIKGKSKDSRKRKVRIKWETSQLLAPRDRKLDEPVLVSYVQVKEIQGSNEKNENPIHWI